MVDCIANPRTVRPAKGLASNPLAGLTACVEAVAIARILLTLRRGATGLARWVALSKSMAPFIASLMVLSVAGLLGACTAPPKADAPSAAAVTASPAAAAPAPPVAAKPPEASAPAPVPAAAPAAPVVDVPRALLAVRNLLDAGEVADAERDLQTILQADPQNKEALSYVRQIREDPQVILGRESSPYRVAAGETLSSIAGRAMKDSQLFFALARYNNIKVPRQLAVGQVIRVPGRPLAPLPSATAQSKPAEATAASKPAETPAPATAVSPAAGTAGVAGPAATASTTPAAGGPPAATLPRARTSAQQVAEFTRTARACGHRQDPCCAVANWDKVLELEPAHSTAKLEKQKEQERIERLRKQGGNPGC